MVDYDLHKLPPAGLGKRLLAALYDWLLVLAVMMVVSIPVVALRGDAIATGNALYQAALMLIAGVFFCGFWVRGGQTLGMRAWRLRLISDHGAAGEVSVPAAARRYLSAWLSVMLLGLGFVWSLFDPQRRAWHDRWSGTRIVVLPKRTKD
ncbi:MAG: RDD family protein [Gammaproteobacteria bacterium]|nr:RDD family protein [Gammaproteobacteria bacterium]